MKRLAVLLVVAACSSYGDEDNHPLPDRNGSSSGTTTGDGGPTSSSGSSSGGAPGDAGLDASGPPFCKTDAAKDAIRCLDFDTQPARPFGFDQIFGNDDNVHIAPMPNGSPGFFASSKALAAYGIFDALPQDPAPLTIAFDVAVTTATGTPMIAGVIGAGTSCPPEQGSLGLLVSSSGTDLTFTVTNLPGILGTAKVGTSVHFSLEADHRPAPGRTITTTIKMNDAGSLSLPAKLPLGCLNFSAALGSTGVFSNGNATATFDNVVLK